MWESGHKFKGIAALMGVILLVGALAGCSETSKFSWDRLKETHYRMVTGKSLDDKKAEEKSAGAPGEQENALGTVNVVLHFADKGGDFLGTEKREIALVPGIARATVEELINGPMQGELMATIPDGTKLLDIDIANGLCRVDLSSEFRDNHWGGSSGEILTVYSLVNTLTQFSTVENVEILVEGEKIETLAGHMDLSAPVSRNAELIKTAE